VLLPSASVVLLLLCNDKEVLGPWVNRPWLNAVAALVVGTLIVLSLILMVTTVFPHIDVVALLLGLFAGLVVALAVGGLGYARTVRRARQVATAEDRRRRETWRMPPLTLLGRPEWTRGRTLAMRAMGGYLGLAVLLLFVKAGQLGAGGAH
jgi:hypothetical protein